MQLKFRIILNVEEDVLRDIVIDSNITLIEFSKIISGEFGFDSSEISTFHHSNENYTTVYNTPYTQGLGVFYREEFDSLPELLRRWRIMKKTEAPPVSLSP